MDLEEQFKAVEKEYFGEYDEGDKDQGADISDTDDNVPDAFLELSLHDIDDREAVSKFFEQACCIKECNKLIPKDMILESRDNFIDLEKDQQDIVILSKIESGKASEILNKAYEDVLHQKQYGKRKLLPGNQGNIIYTYRNLPVFIFLHFCGLKRFKSL